MRFDDATNTGKLTVGYSGKKVLKDLVDLGLRLHGKDALPKEGEDHRPWRALVVDAISLDLQYGFERTAKSLVDGGRNLDARSTFRVQAKYEIDLETGWAHLRDGIRSSTN